MANIVASIAPAPRSPAQSLNALRKPCTVKRLLRAYGTVRIADILA